MAGKDVKERKVHQKASEAELLRVFLGAFTLLKCIWPPPPTHPPTSTHPPCLPVRTPLFFFFLRPWDESEQTDWLPGPSGLIHGYGPQNWLFLGFFFFFFQSSICPLTNKQTNQQANSSTSNTLAQGFAWHSFCAIVTFCCCRCFSVWTFFLDYCTKKQDCEPTAVGSVCNTWL